MSLLFQYSSPHLIKIYLDKNFKLSTQLNYLKQEKNILNVIENNTLRRMLTINNHHVLIQLSSPKRGVLHVDLLKTRENLSNIDCELLVNNIIEWFDLKIDLAPFYKMAKDDPILKHIISKVHGLHHLGLPNLFESLCSAIISQQINTNLAQKIKNTFISQYGETMTYDRSQDQVQAQTHYKSFPSPHTIAKLTVEDLKTIKLSRRKCEYIINIAQLIEQGHLSKTSLVHLNNFKAIKEKLIKIRGIGPWTAHSVLMNCFRHRYSFPVDDLGLIKAIKHIQGRTERPSRLEMTSISDKWGKWKSYAAFYLWQSLNFD